MRRANCLIFALALYWRRWRWSRKRTKRGEDAAVSYICFRTSWVGWGIFHALHGKMDRNTGQIKVVSFKPDTAEKSDIELLFRGHVQRGDRRPKNKTKD
jgi:hypothetical protein